jgi:hypothetical protein
MKTETLLPATIAECERVLEVFPDLSASGFDNYFVEADALRNARRARDGLPYIAKAAIPAVPIARFLNGRRGAPPKRGTQRRGG